MKLYRIVVTLIVLALVALMAVSLTDGAPAPSTPGSYDDAAMKDLKL